MQRPQYWICASALALVLALPNISKGQPQTGPQWSVITTAQIRPEFRQEFEAAEKEISAAYKKAGVPYRLVVQTILGDLTEYTTIAPQSKFAEMDGPSVIERAMGEAASQKFLRRIGGYLTAAHRVTALSMDDISIQTPGDPGAFAHVTTWRLAPGKGEEFVAFMKNDYVPAMKKADVANFYVSRPVFGGDLSERVMVRPMHKLAELDAGPLITKALGTEGARQLNAKQAGIVESVHFVVVRLRLDLSFMPPPPKPAAGD